MIINDQVYTNLTLWPIFLPSKYSPIFSPLPLSILSQFPRFVHPFFLTPCPALSTQCLLMWMIIIWRLPLKEQKTHCDRFWCESQLWPANFTEPFHHGTLWGPRVILEEPSLSLHDIVFVFDIPWASDDTKETQRSHLIIHERNAPIKSSLCLSCYQGNLLRNCCNVGAAVFWCSGVYLR